MAIRISTISKALLALFVCLVLPQAQAQKPLFTGFIKDELREQNVNLRQAYKVLNAEFDAILKSYLNPVPPTPFMEPDVFLVELTRVTSTFLGQIQVSTFDSHVGILSESTVQLDYFKGFYPGDGGALDQYHAASARQIRGYVSRLNSRLSSIRNIVKTRPKDPLRRINIFYRLESPQPYRLPAIDTDTNETFSYQPAFSMHLMMGLIYSDEAATGGLLCAAGLAQLGSQVRLNFTPAFTSPVTVTPDAATGVWKASTISSASLTPKTYTITATQVRAGVDREELLGIIGVNP